ncbi:MAG: acyl-CoA synthetase [Janthinobacterium lividum]
MSHPSRYAATHPDKVAVIMAASGQRITFAELEARSNQAAHLLRQIGLQAGDHIAVMMENNLRYYEVYWGAQRAGLYFTPISTQLTSAEAAYIANDCGAAVVVASKKLAEVAGPLPSLLPQAKRFLMVDGTVAGYDSWEDALAAQPTTPIADETAGNNMFYSSGTTGRPKGIKVPFSAKPIDAVPPLLVRFSELLGFNEDTVYLSPAPLYHSAPTGFSTTVSRYGGTVVVLEKFDPEAFLRAVETYKVTHSQLVPTMFVRMLKLPPEVRAKYDISTLRSALHAAAPCPVAVKEQMIDWWGPIIIEQYSGSEGNGMAYITSEEWLKHKGSVGRAKFGTVRILDDAGELLPAGAAGNVFFEGGRKFEYHNDPGKTNAAYNQRGWSTLGDVGYLDEEGYLYLTDRNAYTIISGGVNIYPQEAENLLSMHPKVADVAVFGVPNEEFGEEVKAVVQPVDMALAGPALEAELIAYCRSQLSAIKCPRSVDFAAQLPRHDTGKLYKRLLRERYWQGHKGRIL